MRISPMIRLLAAVAVASTTGLANAQVKRNGVWQGGDAQKGNPHNLDTEVLHRPPAACSAITPRQRGVFNNASWPNNVIPFEFAANVTPSNKAAMLAAMGELTRVADVKFIVRTTQADYILIQDSDRNNSFVGRIGGQQVVNVFNWNFEFIMVHELMHALGVWHEQSATNRDQFVTVLTENIKEDALSNFDVVTNANTTPLYDYLSLMHYGTYAFSIDPGVLPTIITTDPIAQVFIGQREFISAQDEIGLESMLGDTPPTQWLAVGSVLPAFGIFELPWSSLEASLLAATNGTRIVNIAPATDNGSASPGNPLVIDKFVTIEGAPLTIQ